MLCVYMCAHGSLLIVTSVGQHGSSLQEHKRWQNNKRCALIESPPPHTECMHVHKRGTANKLGWRNDATNHNTALWGPLLCCGVIGTQAFSCPLVWELLTEAASHTGSWSRSSLQCLSKQSGFFRYIGGGGGGGGGSGALAVQFS